MTREKDLEIEQSLPEGPLPEQPAASSRLARLSEFWTRTVQHFMFPFLQGIKYISLKSVKYPRIVIAWTIVLSIALISIGLATNFSMDVDEDKLWTPMDSKPEKHGEWLDDDSGFPQNPRDAVIIIHTNGADVLGAEGVRRCFLALEVARNTPGYDEVCKHAEYFTIDPETKEKTCAVESPTRFWGHNFEAFESKNYNDDQVNEILSNITYPDGEPVDREVIYGKLEVDGDDKQTDKLVSNLAYNVIIRLPNDEDISEPFEDDMLDRVLSLQDQWKDEPGNPFRVDVFAVRTFNDEFTKAIVKDTVLLPMVFIIMSLFCCLVFARRDRVQSQSLVGFGAVVCVLLSISSGFGLLFIIGVPFSGLTQILPFVTFGIGLDDAFIIMGSYNRKDPRKSVALRVEETMDDIGKSIFITTMTSSSAFGLGAVSTVPAVRWLCFYAFPVILIDFVYQISFFVAILAIDDKRVQDGRRDCLVCYKAAPREVADHHGEDEQQQQQQQQQQPSDEEQVLEARRTRFFAEHFMAWYTDVLLKPATKAFVMVFFLTMFGIFAWSTSKLSQEFDFRDLLPSDSYALDFFDASDNFNEHQYYSPYIVFRYVDFSSEDTWDAMDKYVDDIVSLEQVTKPPLFYWLDDFRFFKQSELEGGLDLTFEEQIEQFLNDSVYHGLYSEHIVLDENGVMTASRTIFKFDQVDDTDVKGQIDALEDQRDVTKAQPVNWYQDDWKFFTFHESYYIWEFYAVAVQELILATILGVTAMCAIGILFIPHWSAVFVIGPLVCVLYVDLLGFIQFAGLHINSVTYVAMVMSIGLMVDYLMHVTIKYYEAAGHVRNEKAKEALNTMGASILVGGLSTLLGVIPLAFSTSDIFWSVFVVFIGLVLLGITHGLIFLPVLLSLVGPVVQIQYHLHGTTEHSNGKETAPEEKEASDEIQDKEQDDSSGTSN